MNPRLAVLAVLMFWPGPAAEAASAADREAIRRAALDYAEGYYEGDAAKMERAVHPDLAKRIVRKRPDGGSRVDHMSAMSLVQIVRRGGGRKVPPDERVKDVTILDAMDESATVKLVMRDWIDYLHVGKVDGRWLIINVLWEMKPKPPGDGGGSK
jgi:hypothetical protein